MQCPKEEGQTMQCPKEEGRAMIHTTTLHIILKIAQHEPHKNMGVNSEASEE